MLKICNNCGTEFKPRAGREDTSSWCSKNCFHKDYKHSETTRKKLSESHLGVPTQRLEKIKRDGYHAIFTPDHPNAGKQGYIMEHRLVMEKHLGRYLTKREVVHHINQIITDNRIENLQLCASAGIHTRDHHPEVGIKASIASKGNRPKNYNRGKRNCLSCGEEFETTLGSSGKTFCTRACAYKIRKGKKPKNMEGLKLGRGWNKGIPVTWQLSGEKSPNYKHGRYCKV